VHRAVKMSLENTLRTTHTSAIGAITSHKYHADHSDYLTAHFEIFAPRRNFSGVGEKQVRPRGLYRDKFRREGHLFFARGGFSGAISFCDIGPECVQ